MTLTFRQDFIDAAKAIRDKAAAEGRDLTSAEAAEVERLLEESKHARIYNPANFHDPDLPQGDPRLAQLVHSDISAGQRRNYARLFDRRSLESDGFGGWADYVQAVARAPVYRDDRLRLAAQVWGTMEEGVDSLGGFATPEVLRAELIDSLLVDSFWLRESTVFPVAAARELKVTMASDDDHSAALYGNVTGAWVGEGVAPPFSTAELKQLTLRPKKLAILLQCTNELLADSDALREQLPTMLRQAATFYVEKALFAGTGAGQPLGALNASSAITVSRTTAGTITTDDIYNLIAKLHPALWRSAWWLTSPAALARLATLTVEVKDGSGGVVGGGYLPVLQAGDPPRILGRPVFVSEHMPQLGDAGDLVLVAPREYVIALRDAVTLALSPHFAFDRDVSTFRVTMRLDGAPRWGTTKVLANGEETSWLVKLGS